MIYNSSGILPPTTPLQQDSINILFGPQLLFIYVCVCASVCVCVHVHMNTHVCIWEEWSLAPASGPLCGIVCVDSILTQLSVVIDLVDCLAISLLSIYFK